MFTPNGILQIAIYFVVIGLLIKPVGWYLAQVYEGKSCGLCRLISPLERFIYRLIAVQPNKEMTWSSYLIALLVFNAIGFVFLFLLQMAQSFLPLNPESFPSISWDLAFNTAASFVTNTNWQNYSGEETMSYLTQMLGLTVQNFLSASTGMVVVVALIRGLVRHEVKTLGNFWADMVRTVLYILIPLSILFSALLITQGVIQNVKPYQKVDLIQPFEYASSTDEGAPKTTVAQQIIPMGPVASQAAIKQLGTNGGGFFNTNSAHPFENATALSNFLEIILMLLIPTAFCYTYGLMVKDKRQGWAILLTMMILFVPPMLVCVYVEQFGNPALITQDIQSTPSIGYPSGNMEGKEIRFGITNSSFWASSTTATSTGAVNSMHDSFTPIGGLVPMWFMALNEVVFGGVGSGLYSMLIFILITSFIAGLMTGRTPEYLGKKIEPFEMKMAALVILMTPLCVLLPTAIAVLIPLGKQAIFNPQMHGFSEVFYGFLSMGNNNGSAFAGLSANNVFYNVVGGIVMLLGRFGIIIPILAIAGSLAYKKRQPITAGTLPTHTPLFLVLLISVIIIMGALTFFPALMVGPIVEGIGFYSKSS